MLQFIFSTEYMLLPNMSRFFISEPTKRTLKRHVLHSGKGTLSVDFSWKLNSTFLPAMSNIFREKFT